MSESHDHIDEINNSLNSSGTICVGHVQKHQTHIGQIMKHFTALLFNASFTLV